MTLAPRYLAFRYSTTLFEASDCTASNDPAIKGTGERFTANKIA
jgi:hypothetical protein